MGINRLAEKIRNRNKSAITKLDASESTLSQHPPQQACDAWLPIVNAISTGHSVQATSLENQEDLAECLGNGGMGGTSKSVKVGPVEITGYKMIDVARLLLLILVILVLGMLTGLVPSRLITTKKLAANPDLIRSLTSSIGVEIEDPSTTPR